MNVLVIFNSRLGSKCVIKHRTVNTFIYRDLGFRFQTELIPWIFEKHNEPININPSLVFKFGHLVYINEKEINDKKILFKDLFQNIIIKNPPYKYPIWSRYIDNGYEYNCKKIEVYLDNLVFTFEGDFRYIEQDCSVKERICVNTQFYYINDFYPIFDYRMYDKNKLCNLLMDVNTIEGYYSCLSIHYKI